MKYLKLYEDIDFSQEDWEEDDPSDRTDIFLPGKDLSYYKQFIGRDIIYNNRQGDYWQKQQAKIIDVYFGDNNKPIFYIELIDQLYPKKTYSFISSMKLI